MNSKDIRVFQEKLVEIVNESLLPMEVRRLVLAEVLQKVTIVAEEEIAGQEISYEIVKEENVDE